MKKIEIPGAEVEEGGFSVEGFAGIGEGIGEGFIPGEEGAKGGVFVGVGNGSGEISQEAG